MDVQLVPKSKNELAAVMKSLYVYKFFPAQVSEAPDKIPLKKSWVAISPTAARQMERAERARASQRVITLIRRSVLAILISNANNTLVTAGKRTAVL